MAKIRINSVNRETLYTPPLIRIRANAPVSYTHIRAHETVRDLVCRLLLDKTTTLPKKPIEHMMSNTCKIVSN